MVDDGSSHIWIAGVDTSMAETGKDPSHPAFLMVQQELGAANHTPWWSLY